jgi:hypothetical protein
MMQPSHPQALIHFRSLQKESGQERRSARAAFDLSHNAGMRVYAIDILRPGLLEVTGGF